jgi:hypothetical protein
MRSLLNLGSGSQKTNDLRSISQISPEKRLPVVMSNRRSQSRSEGYTRDLESHSPQLLLVYTLRRFLDVDNTPQSPFPHDPNLLPSRNHAINPHSQALTQRHALSRAHPTPPHTNARILPASQESH